MKASYKRGLAASESRGFTLIELLVVIAIIGILSSVVLASLNSARQKGRDARRVSDIKQLQLALELYYDSNQSYATSTDLAELATSGYIATVPTDPDGTAYTYQPLNNDDTNWSTGAAPNYVLKASLETEGHAAFDGDVDVDFNSGAITCGDGAAVLGYCVQP